MKETRSYLLQHIIRSFHNDSPAPLSKTASSAIRRWTCTAALIGMSATAQSQFFAPLTPLEDDLFSAMNWGMDLTTFEITGPALSFDLISEFNKAESIEERRKAFLQTADPEEYYKLYPKTEEQKQAEASAMASILSPKTREQKRSAQSFDENEADDAAEAAFLNSRGPETDVAGPPTPPGWQTKTDNAPQQ